MKKLIFLILSLSIVLLPVMANGTSEKVTSDSLSSDETVSENANPNQLPRNKTLYYAGQQWGAIRGWNPLSDDMNNALCITQNEGGSRTLMFETLYMYNMLDGSLTPLLADGPYMWNDDHTQMTVKINSAAKWNDGTAVTANDVAATFAANIKCSNARGNANLPYIKSVTAVDDSTVLIKTVLKDDGTAVNPLMVLSYLSSNYVIQEDWINTVVKRNNDDPNAIKRDKGEDVKFSGPYSKYYADDQKVILIRNENYWGQDDSMWGKLPSPKYISQTMFADNAASEVAFKAGEVDVAQLFIPNVQDLWLKDNLPISTYLSTPPYGVCVNMPTAWFNEDIPGLDNATVRKAIAIAVDYDAINANAMTGQSPTFKDVPRSCMNPTESEQSTFDHDAVADLQWVGNDIEGAKKLLDDAGIVDTDGDGIREINGMNLSYNACAPNGWTDWMAAMEIVANAGKKIGINITTEFPEWSVYGPVVSSAHQTDYDIFMMATDSATPIQPWGRIRQLMSSEYNGIEGNWSGNYGHYSNPRLDELLLEIPTEDDPEKLKADYTEAVKIYLTDVPSFSLMYRPNMFYAVNETVWTNYPEANDGNNIPPMVLSDGYGIAGLYKITPIK
jgi:peptide/nickel transport system substrate-binding protein